MGAILLRTRATTRPVQPATVAIRPSVRNVRSENKSSKLFNCERNEPVCTLIKLYGAMPKNKEEKVVFSYANEIIFSIQD